MDNVKRALGIIRTCESDVRTLMTAALSESRYDEIAQLAPLAAALASLASGQDKQDSALPVVVRDAGVEYGPNEQRLVGVSPTQSPPVKAARRRAPDDYPRFERQGDRLLKIGWSKKERSEYEHRAPRDAVRAVADAIIGQGRKKKCFQMEDALPVKMPNGDDVPSYQAYLVLAWLKDMDVVLRQGKDGYRLATPEFDENNLSAIWTQTTERE